MSQLISIVIPVYNAESTIRRCLDSLINQTYQNLEIICVDDGSTDNSQYILREYAKNDKRIKIITQPNKGVSVARNVGIKSATGDWVTGIDSDDYIQPDTYDYCFNSEENILADVICFGIDNNINGKLVPYQFGYYPRKGLCELTYEDLKRINVCFWCKLFKREILLKFGAEFPQNMRFEDVGFHYSVFPYIKKVVYLPERKYVYMTSEGNDSFMNSIRSGSEKILDLLKVLDFLLYHFEEHPLPKEMQNLPSHLTIAYKRMYYHHRKQIPASEMDDIYRNAWLEIVDKHKPLLNFWNRPELLQAYNFPIKIADKINGAQYYSELLALEPLIKRKYRLFKIKTFFSFGKRREKYRNKRRICAFLLNKCKAKKIELLRKLGFK